MNEDIISIDNKILELNKSNKVNFNESDYISFGKEIDETILQQFDKLRNNQFNKKRLEKIIEKINTTQYDIQHRENITESKFKKWYAKLTGNLPEESKSYNGTLVNMFECQVENILELNQFISEMSKLYSTKITNITDKIDSAFNLAEKYEGLNQHLEYQLVNQQQVVKSVQEQLQNASTKKEKIQYTRKLNDENREYKKHSLEYDKNKKIINSNESRIENLVEHEQIFKNTLNRIDSMSQETEIYLQNLQCNIEIWSSGITMGETLEVTDGTVNLLSDYHQKINGIYKDTINNIIDITSNDRISNVYKQINSDLRNVMKEF